MQTRTTRRDAVDFSRQKGKVGPEGGADWRVAVHRIFRANQTSLWSLHNLNCSKWDNSHETLQQKMQMDRISAVRWPRSNLQYGP